MIDGSETGDRPYHHGALRSALLAAAEAELEERGVEAFSLRRVARRAGVSHAAPAHHFSDARGLLTALAAEGFRRFLRTQARREELADPAPRSQLLAAAHGYLDFAAENPALFRLMFASDRPDPSDPDLAAAGEAAFHHLVDQVSAARGRAALADDEGMADVAAAWALVHGLADLRISGHLRLLDRPVEAEQARLIAAILSRVLPTEDARLG